MSKVEDMSSILNHIYLKLPTFHLILLKYSFVTHNSSSYYFFGHLEYLAYIKTIPHSITSTCFY